MAYPVQRWSTMRSRFVPTFAVLAACTGYFESPELPATAGNGLDPRALPETCVEAPSLAPSPLVRLSDLEYRNTVRDLLGIEFDRPLPADETLGLFLSNSSVPLSRLHVETYADAAEWIAAAAPIAELLACSPGDDRVCVETFIGRFGAQAYRRPLSDTERRLMLDLYGVIAANVTVEDAARVLVEGFLQAPQFLYRVEDVVPGETLALDDYEVASRLSYLLWDTMPDAELMAAAETAELGRVDVLEAHARRMLADPRADATLQSFHMHWLGLTSTEPPSKSEELFPQYDGGLYEAMLKETEISVTASLRYGNARIGTLFSTDRTFVNEPLRALYGAERLDESEVPPGLSLPEGFFPARLPETERSGLLTHASLLTTMAHPNSTAPISRGAFVLETLLCVDLPKPPPTVMADPPEPEPGVSARELYRRHADDPGCRGCHTAIDPVGFGFEDYDAIGRYRMVDESGLAIDASGEVRLANDPVPFEGAAALGALLSESDELASCVARQWFRYVLHRREDSGEECLVENLYEKLSQSDGDINELIIAVVTSPAFRHAASN